MQYETKQKKYDGKWQEQRRNFPFLFPMINESLKQNRKLRLQFDTSRIQVHQAPKQKLIGTLIAKHQEIKLKKANFKEAKLKKAKLKKATRAHPQDTTHKKIMTVTLNFIPKTTEPHYG